MELEQPVDLHDRYGTLSAFIPQMFLIICHGACPTDRDSPLTHVAAQDGDCSIRAVVEVVDELVE